MSYARKNPNKDYDKLFFGGGVNKYEYPLHIMLETEKFNEGVCSKFKTGFLAGSKKNPIENILKVNEPAGWFGA